VQPVRRAVLLPAMLRHPLGDALPQVYRVTRALLCLCRVPSRPLAAAAAAAAAAARRILSRVLVLSCKHNIASTLHFFKGAIVADTSIARSFSSRIF
jgi:hypothetical protein